MTTPILLLFGLVAVISVCALLIAMAALYQTKCIWHKIEAHETECRSADAAIQEAARKCNATCTRLLLEIHSDTGRVAGWIEAQDPDFAKRRAKALLELALNRNSEDHCHAGSAVRT